MHLPRPAEVPAGRYSAERAAQLSGIPISTVYDWRRDGVYVPDFSGASPMAWSYRDLVYLRLLAWLRQQDFDRSLAAKYVVECKRSHSRGAGATVRMDGRTGLLDDEMCARLGGTDPFQDDGIIHLMGTFDLLEPIKELGRRALWGPDLVSPSPCTFISPWVMAGEPCIDRTRVPTATVFALRSERGLDEARIVKLYPALTEVSVDDAWSLESRLRRAA